MTLRNLWRAIRPTGEDRSYIEKGEFSVPGHAGGQMARSEHQLYDGFASEWRYGGLHNDSGGSCDQNGALDPLQKDHYNR